MPELEKAPFFDGGGRLCMQEGTVLPNGIRIADICWQARGIPTVKTVEILAEHVEQAIPGAKIRVIPSASTNGLVMSIDDEGVQKEISLQALTDAFLAAAGKSGIADTVALVRRTLGYAS